MTPYYVLRVILNDKNATRCYAASAKDGEGELRFKTLKECIKNGTAGTPVLRIRADIGEVTSCK